MAGETTHSRLGASAAARWLACPGSVALCDKAPPSVASKYAAEGTQAHACAEAILSGASEAWELDAPMDMLAHAEAYCEFVRGLAAGHPIHVEKQLPLSMIDPEAFGTVDSCVVVPGNKIIVVDFKYGAGHAVDVIDNPQLAFYGLAAAEYFKVKPQLIECWIFQPRAEHSGGTSRGWAMNDADIDLWTHKLTEGAKATRQPHARLRVTAACRWCPALAMCPLQAKVATSKAAMDFTDAKEIGFPEPKLLTAKDLSLVLSRADEIKAWLAAVEQWAVNELLGKREVSGWKLVNGRGSRAWADEKKAVSFLTAALGDKMWKKELVSVAQAEKLLPSLPAELVSKKPGGHVLATADDKRAGYSPANDFTEVKNGQVV